MCSAGFTATARHVKTDRMPELTPAETETTTPPGVTTTKAVKPGYKTTEFYLTLIATAFSMLYASGVVSPEGTGTVAKGIALIVAALAAAGYSVSRGAAKKS